MSAAKTKNETLYILISFNGEIYKLTKLLVRSKDLYIWGPKKIQAGDGITAITDLNPNQTLHLNRFPTQDRLNANEIHQDVKWSFHDSGQIHLKDVRGVYYYKDYGRLLHPTSVTDFYTFSPKMPPKEKASTKHIETGGYVANIPRDFTIGRHSLIFKIGLAPKTVLDEQNSAYMKMYPTTCRFEADEVFIYITCIVANDFKQEGIIVIYHEPVYLDP